MKIRIECGNGHTEELTLNFIELGVGAMVSGYLYRNAEHVAGLIDGTSKAFTHKPTMLGKCPLCGRPVKATVVTE